MKQRPFAPRPGLRLQRFCPEAHLAAGELPTLRAALADGFADFEMPSGEDAARRLLRSAPAAALAMVLLVGLLMSLVRDRSDSSEIELVMLRTSPAIEAFPEPEPELVPDPEPVPEPEIAPEPVVVQKIAKAPAPPPPIAKAPPAPKPPPPAALPKPKPRPQIVAEAMPKPQAPPPQPRSHSKPTVGV
jgi:hypothetical protein